MTLWEKLVLGICDASDRSSLDYALDGASMRRLASSLDHVEIDDKKRRRLSGSVRSGVRVSFSDTTEALLSYADIPSADSLGRREGVVVTVRTSSGDTNHVGGMLFVQWDDGVLRQVHRDHLRRASSRGKRASAVSFRVSSLGDISGFLVGEGDNELVHKATKDLWSFKKDGDEYVIERLFNSDGSPLKGV